MGLFEIYNQFKDEVESLYLLGNFSDEITVPLIELSQIRTEDFSKISKRLSFLTAESFQNIVRHGHTEIEKVQKIKFGMFSFATTIDNIILSTVNHISNENAKKLDDELNELKSLNSDELKLRYIETLSNNIRTENGGAGVGFVSILRKTKGNLEYRINKVDEELSTFLFQSNLLNQVENSIPPIKLRAERHFNFMTNNNYLLFRKGIFDHSTMLVMTDLLTVKLNLNTDNVQNKVLFFTITELLQNIYNHGYKSENGHEGMFVVRKEEKTLGLSSGNFVLTENTDMITKTLDEVNLLDKDGINTLLQTRMMEFPILTNDKISSGIGLLEIKKLTNSPIHFNFNKVNDKLSYLTITINIISQ